MALDGGWSGGDGRPVPLDDSGRPVPLDDSGRPVPLRDVPPGAVTRRVTGTLLPGLRDAHVHSMLVDLRAVRRGGICAVTDLGGVPADLARLRAESVDRRSGLPVVEVAGAFLTAPGGYPGDRSWASPGSWREIRSSSDADTAVAEQVSAGATVIKLALNVDAGPLLPARVRSAVVAAAHRYGADVVAHAEGEGAVAAALSAGVDGLAHTPWTAPLGPDLLRACAAQTFWISTLALHARHVLGGPAPGPGDGFAKVTSLANLRGFLGHGGSVRYGTDLGNGPQPLGVNPGEIDALISAGLSPDDVLVAMTEPLTATAGTRMATTRTPAGTARTLAGTARALAGTARTRMATARTAGQGRPAPESPGRRVPPCRVPAGLERDPRRFARSLATAEVVDEPTSPEDRP